ncbi:uncharacterized protein [Procambarus clarkii]|uniref:uncharacterized protein isoform X2 n=1 Tax=Procambarus clarkii TaxID=6728 RepID=UPI003742937D
MGGPLTSRQLPVPIEAIREIVAPSGKFRSPYTVSASCHIEQRHYKSLWQSPFLCRQQDCAYRSGIHTQQHHDGSDVESSAVTRSRRTAAARS